MKFVTKLLFLSLLLSSLSLFADGTQPTGTGSSDDPYLISTLDNLLWLSTTESEWATGTYFEQTADIDATATQNWNDEAGFSPIGNSSNSFMGTYDGNNNIISNLTINRSTQSYVGLLGYVEKGNISNVSLEGGSITGNYYVGGLVGYNYSSSTIINCYTSGAVSGSSYYVGGLVGKNTYSTITNCYATGSISSTSNYVGGLVGYNENTSPISNCYATGSVHGNSYVGGLVGENYFRAIITNSYASGDVFSTGNYVGGLVGYNSSSTITNSYAFGNVSGIGERLGGLVGYNSSSTITNCYASGDVFGTGNYVGGLLGYNYYHSTITNCYASGAVSDSGGNVGGLVGYNENSLTAESSFWDTQTSGQSESAGGTGKTTDEMKLQTTYTVWDFASIWSLDSYLNSGYPYLVWAEDNIAPADIPEDNTEVYNVEGGHMEISFPGSHPDINIDVILNEETPTVVDDELPTTVTELLPVYWTVNTVEGQNHNYVISFDLVDVTGYVADTQWHILKRANDEVEWADVSTLGGTVSYNGTKVTVTGLTTFSEFVPAFPSEESLPVTLSSFTAIQTVGNDAQINWVTASESNLIGYNIFRNEHENIDSSVRLNSEIINAANSMTGSEYSYTDNETENNTTYCYWLKSIELNNISSLYGPVTVKFENDNDAENIDIPELTSLRSIYPNPFNPSTSVRFYVKDSEDVSVDIYNTKGQLIRNLTTNNYSEGFHDIVWNGTDNRGSSCASGVYFFKMKAGSTVQTKKAIMLK